MGGAFGGVKWWCIVGSSRVEPEWKWRAAADITASERARFGRRPDSVPQTSGSSADCEEAARPSVGGGDRARGPKTWLTPIPPRWLNCPRRASRWQVTGTGGVRVPRTRAGPGWAEEVQLSVVVPRTEVCLVR